MNESGPPTTADRERGLALLYAPAKCRAGLEALLALDDGFGRVLRSTREPMVGQMRLAWWRDALGALDRAPPPAEPVLRAIADTVLPLGVTGGMLAGMTDGWERLFDQPIDLAAYARERGGALFAAMARVLGAEDAVVHAAGEGWALADLAAHLSDAATSRSARNLAKECLAAAFRTRWSRDARPIGALALLARADLAGTPAGSPRRVGRLLLHRLTGF